MALERPRHHRHLRNYLLDRDYQLRHAAVLVVVCGALTFALGAAVRHYMGLARRVVEVRALDPTDTLAPLLLKEMRERDGRLLLLLGAFWVLLLVFLFIFGIVFTHKVAGPLHKIEGYMDHIREGRLGQVLELRRGDQLRHFFDSFRQMHTALKDRAQREVAELERAEHLLQQGHAADAAEAIAAIRRRRQEELG